MSKRAARQEAKKAQRQYRRFEVKTRQVDAKDGSELWVEGYAVRFNSPTVLYEEMGMDICEQILPEAFQACDLGDVIFNYNHSGHVMARTRNGTLVVTLDEEGLYIQARLDGTDEGRKMYEEISKGYIDRMSFAFTVAPGGDQFDPANNLWTISKIKRLYDVSAVDIPAYDDTSIAARRADAKLIALEHRTAAEAAAKRRLRIRIKAKLALRQNKKTGGKQK